MGEEGGSRDRIIGGKGSKWEEGNAAVLPAAMEAEEVKMELEG